MSAMLHAEAIGVMDCLSNASNKSPRLFVCPTRPLDIDSMFLVHPVFNLPVTRPRRIPGPGHGLHKVRFVVSIQNRKRLIFCHSHISFHHFEGTALLPLKSVLAISRRACKMPALAHVLLRQTKFDGNLTRIFPHV